MTQTSISDQRTYEMNQRVNSKGGRDGGQKNAKQTVVVFDETPELFEKVINVDDDAFKASDFAHYGSIVVDNNNPDVTK